MESQCFILKAFLCAYTKLFAAVQHKMGQIGSENSTKKHGLFKTNVYSFVNLNI